MRDKKALGHTKNTDMRKNRHQFLQQRKRGSTPENALQPCRFLQIPWHSLTSKTLVFLKSWSYRRAEQCLTLPTCDTQKHVFTFFENTDNSQPCIEEKLMKKWSYDHISQHYDLLLCPLGNIKQSYSHPREMTSCGRRLVSVTRLQELKLKCALQVWSLKILASLWKKANFLAPLHGRKVLRVRYDLFFSYRFLRKKLRFSKKLPFWSWPITYTSDRSNACFLTDKTLLGNRRNERKVQKTNHSRQRMFSSEKALGWAQNSARNISVSWLWNDCVS